MTLFIVLLLTQRFRLTNIFSKYLPPLAVFTQELKIWAFIKENSGQTSTEYFRNLEGFQNCISKIKFTYLFDFISFKTTFYTGANLKKYVRLFSRNECL